MPRQSRPDEERPSRRQRHVESGAGVLLLDGRAASYRGRVGVRRARRRRGVAVSLGLRGAQERRKFPRQRRPERRVQGPRVQRRRLRASRPEETPRGNEPGRNVRHERIRPRRHGRKRPAVDSRPGGPYTSGAATAPTGPAAGTRRVLRGGSWAVTGENVRVSVRYADDPDDAQGTIGFRCARDAKPAP